MTKYVIRLEAADDEMQAIEKAIREIIGGYSYEIYRDVKSD